MSHHLAMLAYDDAQVLDIAGPLEVFARTERWLADNRGLKGAYRTSLVTIEGGPCRTSGGLVLDSIRARDAGPIDTLLVTGGLGCLVAMKDEALLAWVGYQAEKVRRIGSVCTGALVLAAAGLLDGRRATTHWAWLDRLAGVAPSCQVERGAVYVRSEGVTTSAGVTAGIDMALALVEDDYDRVVAVSVARELVMYQRRPGDQPQFGQPLTLELAGSPFAGLETWVRDNIGRNLSIDAMAEHCGMTTRTFARRFRADTGRTAADWVRSIRFRAARDLIEAGGIGMKGVALACGYGNEQALSRAFQREVGISPRAYAERFGTDSQ